jgi:DNA-directed RNA polymerase III subunit RPC1
MVDNASRRSFLRRLRGPGLENLARQSLCKQVLAQARKANVCNHCRAINGTVKKGGPLKIIHERFRQKKLSEEAEKWRNSFAAAIEGQAEVGRFLGTKGLEDLNPLKVLDLFKRMPAEVCNYFLSYLTSSLPSSKDCELVGLKPTHARPEEYLWQYILVPPVAIRPSVAQDGARWATRALHCCPFLTDLQQRGRSDRQIGRNHIHKRYDT